MSTGKQRIEEKHANKRKSVIQFTEKMINKLDGTATKKAAAKLTEKIKEIDLDSIFPKNDPLSLSDIEQHFFNDIYIKLQVIHEEPEKYILAAKNLAKLYVFELELKKQIDKDGMFLYDKKGEMHSHPAVKLLQTTRSQIMTHLKAVGIVAPRATATIKNQEETTFESEFAQFQ